MPKLKSLAAAHAQYKKDYEKAGMIFDEYQDITDLLDKAKKVNDSYLTGNSIIVDKKAIKTMSKNLNVPLPKPRRGPSDRTIQRRLKELRTEIDKNLDLNTNPIFVRIAYAMEHGIRWARLNTKDWDSPLDTAKAVARYLEHDLNRDKKPF